jgi:predicted HTH domain antitoxin
VQNQFISSGSNLNRDNLKQIGQAMATISSKLNLRFDHIEATDPRLIQGFSSEQLGRILGEQLLIARYKAGDFSLGEVAEMLGFYPDIERTRQWLNERGVVQDYSETEQAHLDQSARDLFSALGLKERG